jgi:hypothetical protein
MTTTEEEISNFLIELSSTSSSILTPSLVVIGTPLIQQKVLLSYEDKIRQQSSKQEQQQKQTTLSYHVRWIINWIVQYTKSTYIWLQNFIHSSWTYIRHGNQVTYH